MPVLRICSSQAISTIIVLFVVLSPYTVNQLIHIKSLIPGMLLGQLVAFLLLIHRQQFHHGITNRMFFILCFFSIFLLINAIIVGGSLIKLALFLLLIALLSVNGSLFARRLSQNFDYWGRVFSLAYFVLLALGVLSTIIARHSYVLFIGEASYYALLVGPFALIAYSFNRLLAYFNVLILVGLAFILPNATILIFALIQLGWLFAGLKHKIISVPLLLFVVIYFYDHIMAEKYFSSRFTIDPSSKDFSTLLFLANWLDVYQRITSFHFFGNGIGWASTAFSGTNIYIDKLAKVYSSEYDITYTSGTFWLARAMQTIGFPTLIVVYIVLIKVLACIRYSLRNLKDISPLRHLELILFTSLIPELFFRAGSLLGPGSMMFFVAIALARMSRCPIVLANLQPMGRI